MRDLHDLRIQEDIDAGPPDGIEDDPSYTSINPFHETNSNGSGHPDPRSASVGAETGDAPLLVSTGRPPEPPVTADEGRPFAMPIQEFVALERPDVEPLITDSDGRPLVARHSLTMLGARGGQGKTTLFVELALHLAAGVDYLGFTIPNPVSVLIIENEGPEQMFADKLAVKLANFPHELKAPLDVHTLNWGGFTLANAALCDRLRGEIAAQRYDLVFGDPLDSLGIEGVGSPEDTRKFLELMKATGLHRSVAWWLNTHPRKEETKDALDEIAGAWGGKPDTVLLLNMLEDDRSRLRQPKIRWAKRGRGPTLLLGFDADTETFTLLGEEGEEERDYLTEIVSLLKDRTWRTAKEIAAKKDGDEPGIGSNDTTVKKHLEAHPHTFESRTGEAAQQVGRSPRATVWQLRSALSAVSAVTALEGEGGLTAHCTDPIGAVHSAVQFTLRPELRSVPSAHEVDPGHDVAALALKAGLEDGHA